MIIPFRPPLSLRFGPNFLYSFDCVIRTAISVFEILCSASLEDVVRPDCSSRCQRYLVCRILGASQHPFMSFRMEFNNYEWER